MDSNDFGGAYEFWKKNVKKLMTYISMTKKSRTHSKCTNFRLYKHLGISSLAVLQLFVLVFEKLLFSVCGLECGNDVDGSFRLARCPGDEPSVPKPSLSAPFASHDLGRSKCLHAKPILDRPQPAACRPFFLVLMCFCGLLCSHFPTCKMS